MAMRMLTHPNPEQSLPPVAADSQPRVAKRGRPPGIDAARREALATLVRQGLTLREIARQLGVSRQCVHAQLRKCDDLERERRSRRDVRRARQTSTRQRVRGFQWLERCTSGGRALTAFLRAAALHGWVVEAQPRRRARVNGACLAFHQPHRLRAATSGSGHGARYYHVQLTRAEWLHVVHLPRGRYVFFLPDPNRRVGSYYIPASAADGPQDWPIWPGMEASAEPRPMRRTRQTALAA